MRVAKDKIPCFIPEALTSPPYIKIGPRRGLEIVNNFFNLEKNKGGGRL